MNLQEFVRKIDLRDITLVVHDFGGPIALPICLREPECVKRLVIINTWMWSLKGERVIERANPIVGNRFGRFLCEWANFSLCLLMPTAYDALNDLKIYLNEIIGFDKIRV